MSKPGDEDQSPPRYDQNLPARGDHNSVGQFGQPDQYGAPGQAGFGQPHRQQWNQPQDQWAQPAGKPLQMPHTVNIGSWLVLTAALISTIDLLYGLFAIDIMAGRDALLEYMPNGIVDAIGIVLYILVFFFLRRGANWARILGTVLASLSILSLVLLSFLFFDWIILLITLLSVVGMVMMYLKPSNPWFRKAAPSYGPPEGGQLLSSQPYGGQPGPNPPASGHPNQNPPSSGPSYGNQ